MSIRETVASRAASGRFHYGWVILATGVLMVTGALGLGRFAYTMILPGMQRALNLSNADMGLIATSNLVGYLVFSFLSGLVAARYGARLVVTVSLGLAGVSMVLTGLVPGLAMAMAMRFLTGVGSGGTNVPTNALASRWFAPRRRGMATGLFNGGSGVGVVLGGFLVPRITSRYGEAGWRYSWYYLGSLVILLALLGGLLLRNHPYEKGLRAIGEEGDGAPPVPPERGRPEWGRVFRSPAIWNLAAIYVMFGFSYIIYATYFAKYLQSEGGVSREAAGALWALAVGVLSIASGFLWGAFSDRVGRKKGLAVVYALQGVSYLVFALARSTPWYYASALLFGLTAWSIPAIMAAACGDYAGPRLAPAALGLVTLFFGLGQAAGPWLAGIIADRTHTFAGAFLLAFAGSMLGAVGALFLRPPGIDKAIATQGRITSS